MLHVVLWWLPCAAQDLGDVHTVLVGHNGKGSKPRWHLEKVRGHVVVNSLSLRSPSFTVLPFGGNYRVDTMPVHHVHPITALAIKPADNGLPLLSKLGSPIPMLTLAPLPPFSVVSRLSWPSKAR